VVGYRGYPERLKLNEIKTPNGDYCYYEKKSANLEREEWYDDEEKLHYRDENVSVSWMDTGLPITQKLDCSKIWRYMTLLIYYHFKKVGTICSVRKANYPQYLVP